jgi:hypothetical protein
MALIETVTVGLQAFLVVVLYFIFGFGPGFIVGVWIANRFGGGGKKQPLRIDQHKEQIEKAAAHNAQWHPDHERWKGQY